VNLITLQLRSILDSFRDTIKVIRYFNMLRNNNFLIIIKIFIIKFFFSKAFIRNFIKTNKKKIILNEIFFKENNQDIYKLTNQVDQNGYSEILTLKEKYINEIKELIFKCEDLDIKKINNSINEIKKKTNETEIEYYKRLEELKISRVTGSINLNEKSVLKDLLTCQFLIQFAKSYLNTNSISVNASFFISNPLKISETEKYSNAQYFHWDNDFTKFFKFYIYLSDVDEDSGPHIFIPGTHKKKKKIHKLSRLFDDKNIYSSYKEKKIFHGKKGSAFLVDSYGLHKGETPKNKPRLMLNIHYGRGKIFYSKNDMLIKI